MQLWQQTLAAIAVGLLWGISNPLTRQGALQLKRRQQSDPLLLSTHGRGWLRTVNHVRRTPLLILPQVRYIAYTIWTAFMLVHGQAACHERVAITRYTAGLLHCQHMHLTAFLRRVPKSDLFTLFLSECADSRHCRQHRLCGTAGRRTADAGCAGGERCESADGRCRRLAAGGPHGPQVFATDMRLNVCT